MADVIVIGSGVGGLAAAIELARAGHRVTVLEARDDPGGKVGRASADGVEFDTGPSLLTLPDVARYLVDGELDLVQHARPFLYRWPDGTAFTTHHTADATVDEARAVFGAQAADELRSFYDYAATIWSEAAPVFVFGDAPTFSSVATLGVRALASFRRIDPFRTMARAIDAHVRTPHLRDVLYRYATYNGSDPRRAPATLNCIVHVEQGLGAWGIRGGMYELVRALVAAAERLGVELVYGARVERIATHHRRVTAVEAQGRSWPADAVVANPDVHHVFADLLGDPSKPRAAPSTSGWTAVVRAHRRPERAPHTVLFPRAYTEEFAALFDQRRVPAEPTLYICAQEPAHNRTGWLDHEPLFLMVNAPADAPIDTDRLEHAVLDRLRVFDLWNDRDTIVWRRSPADLAAHFPGSGGAIYGAASNTSWAAFQRPANRCPQPHGLYLASGSAHPGGGVPLALLSGRAAARAVVADYA